MKLSIVAPSFSRSSLDKNTDETLLVIESILATVDQAIVQDDGTEDMTETLSFTSIL